VNIDISPTDFGGELDPNGQDLVRRVQKALESFLLIVCTKERKPDGWLAVLNRFQSRWSYL
jgi:hypothetical protein